MIVSASYRTDIPAFYADWFARRLAAGAVRVANPYGGPAYRVSLKPEDVTGYVFWTRNAAPFAPALEAVARQGVPFVVQYTLTGYPRALEARVPAVADGLTTIRSLAERFGPRCVVWRYDPVLLSSLTPPEFHHENLARLAAALAGAVDEVCLSFAQIYRKTAGNLRRAGERQGFDWRDPEREEKRALLAELAGIAAGHGIAARICAQPELDLPAARCIDLQRLSDIAGHQLDGREKGNRPGCLCAESRDIGAYDSCPHGCVYCYAVRDRDRARQRFREHDAAAEGLGLPAGR